MSRLISRLVERRKRLWLSISMLIIVAALMGSLSRALARQPVALHPLDPITADEIKTAVAAIKQQRSLSLTTIFTEIALREPNKAEVLNFKSGEPLKREARAVIYDRSQNQTYEAVINLSTKKLSAWQEIEGVQPAMADPDYELAGEAVKADPQWQAAMRRRGITNFDDVELACWAPGILSEEETANNTRICRMLTYYKGDRANFFGSPIEGVLANVNLITGKVINVVDTGVVPFSQENWDYDPKSLGKLRAAAKPLRINQPKGASFQINGHEISWQGWKFRYAMHPRDGLVLYRVTYNDEGKARSVLYRASLSEMVVPYGDPHPNWSFRNAFDVGEYNFGILSNSLDLGKEIPENGVLLDAVFADYKGEPYAVPNVLGIYEQNNGILWKHYDGYTERNYAHPNRELVLTTVGTIDNYDYAINWVFHQDGSLEVRNELSGIVLAQATASQTVSDRDAYGELVAKNIVGVNHQHFLNFRLDMDVDGQVNSVMEMNVKPLPLSQANPLGNAFVAEHTMLPSEQAAIRNQSMSRSREWTIASTQQNALGAPTGYMFMPGSNVRFLPSESAQIRDRAGFATHHFWVTKYKPDELHAGGEYPNHSTTNQGLPTYTANNEPIVGEDLVVWYTQGVTHIPRPEDWPVMPVHRVGFKLVPKGFFTRNPAINLPEPAPLD